MEERPGPAEGEAGAGVARYGEQDGPGMKTEAREAALTVVALAVSGVLFGLLWWWLTPRVPLVGERTDGNWVVYLKDSEGEQSIAVDGTFALLGVGFGVLAAVILFVVRRRGGPALVVALGLGTLLGSLVAWRVGVWLGPSRDVVAHARSAGEGATFPAPLRLGAKGALLAWPLAALAVHLALTGMFGPRDPEQESAFPEPPREGEDSADRSPGGP
ncbi:AAA family ATPase [Streptomyces sp. ZYX-F-203]